MAALLLLCTLPAGPLPHRVDVIEVNHVHDANGRHSFTQAILWHDTAEHGRHVVAWRIWRAESAVPTRGGWSIRWHGRPGAVRSPLLRETWTQYDVELRERPRLPPCERRGLRE